MLTSEQKENARKKQDLWLLNFKKQKKIEKRKKRKFFKVKNNNLLKKDRISKKNFYLKRHRKYINSHIWRLRKQKFFDLFGKKCKRCGSEENINLHHNNYSRMGKEKDKDLMSLCQNCHTEFHKIYGTKSLKKNTLLFIK